MSDDVNADDSEDASLLRRVFLKLGLTGVAGLGLDLSDRTTAAWRPTRGRGAADAATSAPRDVPQVEFLPPVGEVVSARGLNSAETFSLSSVAVDHAVDRRPLSVRELVTPQNPRSTTDAATYRELPVLGSGQVKEVAEWLGVNPNDRITWGNWLQDPDHMTHATVVGTELSSHEDGTVVRRQPEQRRALIGTVVRTATDSFRGVGSGHSHSEAATPEDGFNDLKDVTGKLPQPDTWIKNDPPASAYDENRSGPIDTDHLIRVGAGTVLKELNRVILPSEDLALPNMGSWDGQTLAGAVNTSTHGTGLELGSLADIVRSVEILVVPESPTADEPLVRMLRVEPEDGITDPVAFARDAQRHDMTLIQDDDLFHSVVVGYGSMGIVYAYTIECQDPYWLREEGTFRRWNEIDPVAEAQASRHYKVNINLAAGSRNPRCWTRSWTLADRNGREPTERRSEVETVDDFIRTLPERIGRRILQESDPWGEITPTVPPWYQRRQEDPEPFKQDRTETASYIALRRRWARHPDEPSRPPEQPPDFLSTEVAVPRLKTEAAAQAVIDHVHRHDRLFLAPLSIRYAAGSEHYLSPDYGRDDGSAVVELLMPAWETVRAVDVGEIYLTDQRKIAKAFKQLAIRTGNEHLVDMSEAKRELEAVEEILVDQFDGRPHLGKHNTVDAASNQAHMRPQNMFPEYETWLAAHRYVNQYGTFDAEFTDNKVR